jgi:hypothetical protein
MISKPCVSPSARTCVGALVHLTGSLAAWSFRIQARCDRSSHPANRCEGGDSSMQIPNHLTIPALGHKARNRTASSLGKRGYEARNRSRGLKPKRVFRVSHPQSLARVRLCASTRYSDLASCLSIRIISFAAHSWHARIIFESLKTFRPRGDPGYGH